MDWKSLLSPKRLFGDVVSLHDRDTADVRGPYLKDADRITYSPAFRRLKNRTQVYPLATSEYVRTRLTHSMEVASIGRSLGLRVGREILKRESNHHNFGFESQGAFVQSVGNVIASASLAHDLGSPPFGHTGERAIRYFFGIERPDMLQDVPNSQKNDFVLYDSNAHTFRIISRLEFWKNSGGMQLTCATISTVVKSPWNSTLAHQRQAGKFPKFGYFQSETELFDLVFQEVGLKKEQIDHYVRHPLSYLLDAADEMTYLTADLEDGANMGLVEFGQAESLLLKLSHGDTGGYDNLSNDRAVKLAFLRARALGILLGAAIRSFLDCYHDMLSGNDIRPLLDQSDFSATLKEIRHCCQEQIFGFESKQGPEFSGWNAVRNLIRLYCDICLEMEKRNFDSNNYPPLWTFDPPAFFKEIQANTSRYDWLMRVLDFVLTLSDRRTLDFSHGALGLTN
jgi:dGTPase